MSEREIFFYGVGFHAFDEAGDLEPVPFVTHDETVCEWPRC